MFSPDTYNKFFYHWYGKNQIKSVTNIKRKVSDKYVCLNHKRAALVWFTIFFINEKANHVTKIIQEALYELHFQHKARTHTGGLPWDVKRV